MDKSIRIAAIFGYFLGDETIKIAGEVYSTINPPEQPPLQGFGDIVEVGDVVSYDVTGSDGKGVPGFMLCHSSVQFGGTSSKEFGEIMGYGPIDDPWMVLKNPRKTVMLNYVGEGFCRIFEKLQDPKREAKKYLRQTGFLPGSAVNKRRRRPA